jgi:hypothetical protein
MKGMVAIICKRCFWKIADIPEKEVKKANAIYIDPCKKCNKFNEVVLK